jgi:hypothetical protein
MMTAKRHMHSGTTRHTGEADGVDAMDRWDDHDDYDDTPAQVLSMCLLHSGGGGGGGSAVCLRGSCSVQHVAPAGAAQCKVHAADTAVMGQGQMVVGPCHYFAAAAVFFLCCRIVMYSARALLLLQDHLQGQGCCGCNRPACRTLP